MSFWNTKEDLRVSRYLHLRQNSLFAGFTLVSAGLKKMYRTLKLLKNDENGIETVPCNCWLSFSFFWDFPVAFGYFQEFYCQCKP